MRGAEYERRGLRLRRGYEQERQIKKARAIEKDRIDLGARGVSEPHAIACACPS